MKDKTNQMKDRVKLYTVERNFLGARTAEDVVADLVKVHC